MLPGVSALYIQQRSSTKQCFDSLLQYYLTYIRLVCPETPFRASRQPQPLSVRLSDVGCHDAHLRSSTEIKLNGWN